MNASVHGAGGRPGLRWTLAAVLLLDLYGVIENFFIIPAPEETLPWSPSWLLSLNQMVWPLILLALLYALGTAGFARGKHAQLWFGLLVLVAMAVLVEAMGAHVGQHRRRFYSTGAALAGWLVGLLFARLRQADEDRSERLAEAGAAAALAATYVGAGIQKILAGGLFHDHSLQAHIFTHHRVDDSSVLGALARAVAHHPQAGMGLALATLTIQLGALLYLSGPRMRMVWGTLLIAFHLGTQVFLHIIYIEAAILLVAWSYPWARILARLRGAPQAHEAPEDPPADFSELILLGGVALFAVGAAWVAPTPHELDRPHLRQDPPRAATPP